MYDSDSKGITYTAGFFMLIAFAVAGLIIGAVISVPVWQQMTGISFKKMQENMTNPACADAIKVIQVITVITGLLFPAVLTAFLLNRKPLRLMGFKTAISWKQAGLAVAILVTGLIISGSLSYINQHIPLSDSLRRKFDGMEKDYMDQAAAILSLNTTGQYILSLFIMAFLPALCEEALFRAGLQNFLTRAVKNPWISILIVSLLFSLSHVSYYGFLSRFFLGMILGFLYHYSRSIWPSVLAHFLNNALVVTVLFISGRQGKPVTEAMKESTDGSWWGILLVPAIIGLFIVFRNSSPAPAKNITDGL